MIVAPSIIAADFSQLQKEIKKVEKAGADLLHLDVMDGVFVPNLTFGPMMVEAINKMTDLELDVHLMIAKPEKYLGVFIDAGADWISFHAEASNKTDKCIRFIRNHKKKVGLAISPGTPLRKLTKYLAKIDFILIMTVNPGFYGQKFMPEILKKISEAKSWLVRHHLPCSIQVDGGISHKNAEDVARAGADIVVAGASIFKSRDYKRAVHDLRCSKV